MKELIVTLIAVGLFLLIGCSAPDTPQTTPVAYPSDILGTWQVPDGYVEFKKDGTVRFATSREELADKPITVAEFWFEGEQYFEKEIEVHDRPACGGLIGIYEVGFLENGNLTFTKVEDKCQFRASFAGQEHIRVE
jgi:hypothetical protein